MRRALEIGRAGSGRHWYKKEKENHDILSDSGPDIRPHSYGQVGTLVKVELGWDTLCTPAWNQVAGSGIWWVIYISVLRPEPISRIWPKHFVQLENGGISGSGCLDETKNDESPGNCEDRTLAKPVSSLARLTSVIKRVRVAMSVGDSMR